MALTVLVGLWEYSELRRLRGRVRDIGVRLYVLIDVGVELSRDMLLLLISA